MNRRIGILTNLFTHVDVKFAALLVQFLASISFNLMNSFISLFISNDLNYPLIEATYWAGIYQLVGSGITAIAAPFTGYICDRTGIKKILMIILAANIAVYAGMAMSTSALHVILFRGLQGVFGGVSTIMFTFIASIASAEELKKSLSYQLAAMTTGQVIGPGIGGIIASVVGYRLTFATTSLLFLPLIIVVSMLKTPPPTVRKSDAPHFGVKDYKTIIPDAFALILIYACINFIKPTVPWFLRSLGIPNEQLLTFTTLFTMLSGLAFATATFLLTRVVTDRNLPILSTLAAGVILATAFSRDFYQFLLLVLLTTMAGIPPNLFGGKSERRGTAMGFLNSARFIGQAIGPFIAISILGDGEPPRALYVFATMTSISLAASILIYLVHTRKGLAESAGKP